jgi:hypothetical protein
VKLIIELDEHDAEHMHYRANSVNGGHLYILVPDDGGYREVELDKVVKENEAPEPQV